MKLKNVTIVILLLLIAASCGHNIEKISENNFAPPSVKIQPRFLYPKVAQENGYTGTAKIIFTVMNNGSVDKVSVEKSTGYKILDNAAIDYCRQIVFNPAERNGKQVSCRIIWDINFNISDVNSEANSYLLEIERLYRDMNYSGTENEKRYAQKQILKLHDEFINNMKDALSFNLVLRKTLSPNTVDEWKDVWDSWPLSFLLYHDFLIRFNDYDSIADVKMKMNQALNFDIKYIENTASNDLESQKQKEIILSKINEFIARKYPEIQLKKNI